MMPFADGDPRSSWEVCRQLHEGKLWKCPNIAYLGMQAEKFSLDPAWEPYLEYVPLSMRVQKQDPMKPQVLRKTGRVVKLL